MATLFNTKISATYPGLIKTIDNAAISATLKQLSDGSGNLSGLFVNTGGDFKVTAILEWGSLKDTGTGVTITQFVTAANGIANFNNDTTIPTSAAVKTYVDAVVTASDLDFKGDSGTGEVDLDSQLLEIAGTTNEITTVALNQKLIIGLPNSVTISGTYTGATFLGDLNGTINTATTATTQTAGNNSTKVATTAYVDSLDAASDLDFSGDSGTGDVTLNTQVLAITGTTNQIVTTAANQGLSLSLPATVHRNLQGNVTGNVDGDLTGNVTATSVLVNGVSATTQSSSDSSTKVATTAYVKGLNNASDLDFTTDSGSGAVVLNTETFSVLGTTNQINSAGTGQAITLSLPTTIHRNLLGNVTGDLTGNADTATAWETARSLSVTGEATGTLLNVNGTQPVSGAVTLDNNSVTGKVLTGLPTPAAATVLATDSILDGFGKLQSQINGIANGLQFQGAWNATSNSPVLVSGGNEAASGTTTATTTNKLVDSSANFTSTVTVGDKVINQVDRQTALVTGVDSNTILSLASDIMLTGEAYTIDNSPFITQGHYYVVNVGGTHPLNGINSWSVGDWVIAGSTNVWEKLDHTDVEGTGTPGNIAKWLTTGTIADSIMAETGAIINVSGSVATTAALSSAGNFSVNTNKLTANATTGNVAILGDFAINTNKFTVNATSGNTLAAGTMTSPTFLGDLNGTINTSTTAVTQSANNNSTKVATTAYVDTSAGLYLPLAGGIMTGNILMGNTVVNPASGFSDQTGIGLKYSTTVPTLEVSSDSAAMQLGRSSTGGEGQILGLRKAGVIIHNFDTNNVSIGTTATFAGNVLVSNSTTNSYLNIDGANSGGSEAGMFLKIAGVSKWETYTAANDANYNIYSQGQGIKLAITPTGNATFAGNVTLTSALPLLYLTNTTSGTGKNWRLSSATNGKFFISQEGVVDAVTLDHTSGNATFAGNVLVGSGSTIYADLEVKRAGEVTVALHNSSAITSGNRGNLAFYNSSVSTVALIKAVADTDNVGTALEFYTRPVGGSLTNSMTIDSSGTTTFAGNVNISSAGDLYINSGTSYNNKGSIFMSNQRTEIVSDIVDGTANGDTSLNFKTRSGGGAGSALFIDEFRRIGIGTETPGTYKLNVQGGPALFSGAVEMAGGGSVYQGQKFWLDGGGDTFLESPSSNLMTFTTNGTEKLSINTTGEMKLGTGTNNAGFIDFDGTNLQLNTQRNPNTGAFVDANKSNAAIQLSGANGGSFIRFNTAAANNTTSTERMRIDSSGNVGIGTENNIDAPLTVQANGGGSAINIIGRNNGVADESIIGFYQNDGTTRMAYILADEQDLDFATGGSNVRMKITSGGDIQFPTDSAKIQLRSSGSSAYTSINRDSSNSLNVRNTAGNAIFSLENGGNLTIAGNLTQGSDITLKENIKPLQSQLDIANKLNPVSYNRIGKKENEIGFIAQEVEKLIPDLVSENPDGLKSLAYGNMTSILVKAIQELTAKVERLEQECKCK